MMEQILSRSDDYGSKGALNDFAMAAGVRKVTHAPVLID
jgi:hypothetical protein